MGCSASYTPEAVECVQASEENIVVVDQEDQRLLGMKFRIASGCLVVRMIESGAIKDWNAQNPGHEVSMGDEVLSVNGESENMSKMLTELHRIGQIEIRFRSIPQASASSAGQKRLGHPCCKHDAAGNSSETQRSHRKPAKGTQLVELPFVSAAHLEDATCCICLESMEPEVRVLQLPCKHHFHLECGAQWLRQKGTCPLCVRPLIAEPERKTSHANELVTL